MSQPKPIAALYVMADSIYNDRAGVDPWPEARNAKLYPGPAPVIAHPPCGPWGRYAWKCKQDKTCGPIAAEQVRRWGGVLEHPAHSKLWSACNLPRPHELPDVWGGLTIEVDQSRWGHPCPKVTWLYLCRVRVVPSIPPPVETPPGRVEFQSRKARKITPPALAEWLIEAVRSVEVAHVAA